MAKEKGRKIVDPPLHKVGEMNPKEKAKVKEKGKREADPKRLAARGRAPAALHRQVSKLKPYAK